MACLSFSRRHLSSSSFSSSSLSSLLLIPSSRSVSLSISSPLLRRLLLSDLSASVPFHSPCRLSHSMYFSSSHRLSSFCLFHSDICSSVHCPYCSRRVIAGSGYSFSVVMPLLLLFFHLPLVFLALTSRLLGRRLFHALHIPFRSLLLFHQRFRSLLLSRLLFLWILLLLLSFFLFVVVVLPIPFFFHFPLMDFPSPFFSSVVGGRGGHLIRSFSFLSSSRNFLCFFSLYSFVLVSSHRIRPDFLFFFSF